MSTYNQATYLRAQAAALTRKAACDEDLALTDDSDLYRELAMAQAFTRVSTFMAHFYLRRARALYKALAVEGAAKWSERE